MTAAELREQVRTKRDELGALFAKHEVDIGDGKKALKMDTAALTEARQRNEELTPLVKQMGEAEEAEALKAANERSLADMATDVVRPFFNGGNGNGGDGRAVPGQDFPAQAFGAGQKTLGELFIESQAYKSWDTGATSGQMRGVDFKDVYWSKAGPPIREGVRGGAAAKATFDIAGSTFTQYDRPVGLVLLGQQKLTVADLLAKGETTMNTIRYPQEDTFTNAATTVAEGATKPEASWDTSEVDAPVRKIAVTSKVTEEMWEDFPLIRDYINERLPFMVRQREEAQLLTGNGTPPNLTGLLNVSGIQTQATGADTNPDAIYKAIVKVRTVGFFEPDAVVIHPNNWTPIRLLKTTTGEYVWGAPSEMGPERIWGLLTDVTTGITANTALVGAYQLGAQVFYRTGLRMEATNSNEDDFKKNLIAIRCEIREALAVYRPKAFAAVTGLST